MIGRTEILPLRVVGLLIALEARRVSVAIGPDGDALLLEPAESVTAAEQAVIEDHFDEFFMGAAFVTDAGVRVRAFVDRTTTNCVVPDTPYIGGRCFSCGCECGARNSRPQRCWRCRVAWRLACALEPQHIAEDRAASDLPLEYAGSRG